MRIAMVIALIALVLPVSGRAQPTAGAGHFDGWPADAQWGADKQTFEARLCTPAVVNGPHPADLSKIRALLEAASSETR